MPRRPPLAFSRLSENASRSRRNTSAPAHPLHTRIIPATTSAKQMRNPQSSQSSEVSVIPTVSQCYLKKYPSSKSINNKIKIIKYIKIRIHRPLSCTWWTRTPASRPRVRRLTTKQPGY
uniref:Uncharacterized protein n=1 Tax=Cacopsylla melanoneura TaxID=428564 RepID=A0A8D8Z363_9HEMI